LAVHTASGSASGWVLTRIASFVAFNFAVATELRAWAVGTVLVGALGCRLAGAGAVGGQLADACAVVAGLLRAVVQDAVVNSGVAIAHATSINGRAVVELDGSSQLDGGGSGVALAVEEIKVVIAANSQPKSGGTA
jgi:hypothetical protein